MPQPALPIVIQAIDRASSVLTRVRAEVAATANAVDQGNAGMQRSTDQAARSVSRSGRILSAGITAAGIAAIGSSVAAGKFNFTLARTGVFAKATATDLRLLRQALLQGTERLQILPTEAAEAAQQLARVGLSARDVTKAVVPTLELMIAAGKELGPDRAAKVMFQGMTLFGKGAEDARGIAAGLAATFATSAIDANKLTTGFQILASGAKQVGASFEDTATILGLIANIFPDRINRGVRSASRLFEDLNVVSKRQNFEAAFGVRVLNQQGTGYRRLRDIVTDVTGKLLRLNPVQRASAIEASGLSIEARRALGFFVDLANAGVPNARGELVKGAQVFKVFGDNIENEVKTGGSLDKLQKAMEETLPGALKLTGAAFQRVGIALGSKIGPTLIKFLNGLTRALNAFANVIENLGPGATKLIGWLGTLLTITTGLRAIGGLGRLFAGAALPRGLVGALVGRGGAAAAGGLGGGLGGAASTAAGVAAPGLLRGAAARFGATRLGGAALAGGKGILSRVPLLALAAGVGLTFADLVGVREARAQGLTSKDRENSFFFQKAARALGFAQGVTNRQEYLTMEAIQDQISRSLGEDDRDIPGVPNAPGPERVEALLGLAEGPEGLGGALRMIAQLGRQRDAAASADTRQNITLEVDRQVLARVVRDVMNEQGRVENGARFTPGF